MAPSSHGLAVRRARSVPRIIPDDLPEAMWVFSEQSAHSILSTLFLKDAQVVHRHRDVLVNWISTSTVIYSFV